MVKDSDGHYKLNQVFVFDEEVSPPKDSLLFKVKESNFGWRYLRNAVSMADFARRII